jgi:hypothetical protein
VIDCTYDGLNNPLDPTDPPLEITVVVAVTPPAAPVVTNTATVTTVGDLNLSNNVDSAICASLPPAPAPLLSPGGMAAAGLVLLGVAFVALRRRAVWT